MNVAMIGAGNFARTHLDALEKEEGVQIVGHVSPTAASREAAARRYGGRAYASCEELLRRENVDAAWISVPPHAHGTVEQSLIDRNVPFFVEKPLSHDRPTAERIASQLAERELVVGVGYKFRAMSVLARVRSELEQRPPQLVSAAWHGGTPAAAWWQRRELSGGQLVEQATHLIDLARYLLGEAKVTGAAAHHQPRPAYPKLNLATTTTAMLTFDSGITGFVSTTCLLEDVRDIYLQLNSEKTRITIRPEVVVFDTNGDCEEVSVSEDLVATEDRAFLQAVRQNDSSLLFSTYGDALLTHRLCFDILEKAGQPQI